MRHIILLTFVILLGVAKARPQFEDSNISNVVRQERGFFTSLLNGAVGATRAVKGAANAAANAVVDGAVGAVEGSKNMVYSAATGVRDSAIETVAGYALSKVIGPAECVNGVCPERPPQPEEAEGPGFVQTALGALGVTPPEGQFPQMPPFPEMPSAFPQMPSSFPQMPALPQMPQMPPVPQYSPLPAYPYPYPSPQAYPYPAPQPYPYPYGR